MKRILLIALIISTVFAACKKDDQDSDESIPVDKTFNGSLINPTTIELQEFYDEGYKNITGDIIIENDDHLINLNSLAKIKKINGSLILNRNKNLETLYGLDSLISVGDISISFSLSLSDLCSIKELVNNNGIAGNLVLSENLYNPTIEDFNNGDCQYQNSVIVFDSVYISGAGTSIADLDLNGMLQIARNEVTQEDRTELLELYIAVKAGTDGFNIITVNGGTETLFGPGDDFALVTEADLGPDEPQDGLWRGAIKETDTKFTVPENALYHVVFDTELMKVAIAKVNWGIIGGATPGGWGESTAFNAPAFDLNTMTYEIPSVTIREDTWKFRYSNGWKIILDADIKANTNYGGTVNALVAGGHNIINEAYANYKITITYTLGSPLVATFEYESDAEEIPIFPEAMYLVGGSTAYGWDEPGTHDDAIMHKCAGGEELDGLYWKILHIETGLGFKISAAQWEFPNLGFAEVDEFDSNGVAITSNNGDMEVPESGMYMVILDLRNDTKKLSVISPEVYGIGDVFGSWEENVAANLFTVDNTAKTLISPAFAADGNVRMYVSHEWIPAWWNSEFNVFSGAIEYRNDGGDQEAVSVTAGQTATLTFDDNTGVIQ